MKLTWEDYNQIAELLADKYADVDLINVTDEEVIEMVTSLDDFDDSPEPPDSDLIDAIINVWATISDDSDFDDSKYDAYV